MDLAVFFEDEAGQLSSPGLMVKRLRRLLFQGHAGKLQISPG